jgi:hypothetical protein
MGILAILAITWIRSGKHQSTPHLDEQGRSIKVILSATGGTTKSEVNVSI